MAAYKRLRLDVDTWHVSAALLPEVGPDEADTIVCKACSPAKTKIQHQLTLVQLGFERDKCWAVFRCGKCKREYALPYFVPHAIEESKP